METTNRNAKGGSAFLWGFVLGALFATLLTTKKGRQILKDLIDLGLDLVEDFVDQKNQGKKFNEQKVINSQRKEKASKEMAQNVIEAEEDLESEIAEDEVISPAQLSEEEVHEQVQDVAPAQVQMHEIREEKKEEKTTKNGHFKKRLFRGIRKK